MMLFVSRSDSVLASSRFRACGGHRGPRSCCGFLRRFTSPRSTLPSHRRSARTRQLCLGGIGRLVSVRRSFPRKQHVKKCALRLGINGCLPIAASSDRKSSGPFCLIQGKRNDVRRAIRITFYRGADGLAYLYRRCVVPVNARREKVIQSLAGSCRFAWAGVGWLDNGFFAICA